MLIELLRDAVKLNNQFLSSASSWVEMKCGVLEEVESLGDASILVCLVLPGSGNYLKRHWIFFRNSLCLDVYLIKQKN